MASFTDEEIQAAVETMVQSTISRPYDTLGVRRTDLSFTEIQQAAAGVFLLYPKAPFYCLYLGAQAAEQALLIEAQQVTAVLEAIKSTGRAVVPITDVSPLFNARAALDALGQAALGRSTGFQDITAVPAYQRFSSNVDAFVDQAGPAIKDNGQVVETPQAARLALPALISNLSNQHAALVARVKLLAAGSDDYSGLNLSSLVAQGVIAKASAVLGAHADELQGLLPDQRLAKIRQVILDLLVAKSVVTTYGSFTGATEFYAIQGTGAPYSDATHLAEPALLQASVPGPYNMQLGGNILDLFLDGAGATPRTLTAAVSVADGGNNRATITVASIPLDVLVGDVLYFRSGSQLGSKWIITSLVGATVTAQGTVPAMAAGATTLEILPQPTVTIALPYAFSPQLFGTRPETQYTTGNGYIVGDGSHPIRPTDVPVPTNNQLIVVINGVQYPVTLTLSADGDAVTEATPRTAQQVCDDINAVTVAHGYVAEPYLNPRRYLGYFVQSIDAGTSAFFDLLGGFGNLGSLGIVPGMLLNVLDGDGTQQGLWLITAVTATRATATNVLSTSAIAQVKVTAEIGESLRAIKMRAVDPHTACANLDSLGTTFTGAPGPDSTTFKTATLLGLSPGGVSTARLQTAKEIATAISTSSSLVTAIAQLAPSLTGLAARTEPTNSSRVTFSKLLGTATTTYAAPHLTAIISGALTAGVEVGDLLVERGGNNIGTIYAVTAVTDAHILADYVSGTGSTQTMPFTIELGADPSSLNPYDLLRIEDGPCQGDYYVLSVSGLDVALNSTLPVSTDPATGLGTAFTVSVGPEYVYISNKTTTTASRLKARGNAELAFFTHNAGVQGTSVYFKLPQKVKGLSPGDLFLQFASNYSIVSGQAEILNVEGDILTLDTLQPSDVTWNLNPNATVPFARLKPRQTFDFTDFQRWLNTWLALPEQQPAFFTDLNRLINPLIANSSPTGVAVGDALNKVKDLAKNLDIADGAAFGGTVPLEEGVQAYMVDQVTAVDALLRSFRDKGADRAVDFLIGGQFQAFFDMDQDDASYAGSMQKAMRGVVLNDLAVTKTNRPDAKVSRLLSTTKDPDPDFDLSDTENAAPDPAGQGDF